MRKNDLPKTSKENLRINAIHLKSSLELLEEQLKSPNLVGSDMDILLNMVANASQAISKECKQAAKYLNDNLK